MPNEPQRAPRPRDAAKSSRRQRTFLDLTGQRWQVHETEQPSFDRRGGTCLVFASDDTIRRVRSFPENWFDLSDVELLRLSWNR